MAIDKITQDLILENEKARSDEVTKNIAKESIQNDNVRKSTIANLNFQRQILTDTFADLSKIISSSDKDITEQLNMQANLINALEGGIGSDSLESTLLKVSEEVGDIPGSIEALQNAASKDRAAQNKVNKLKEKEDEADKKKLSFSFQDSVDKVKDVGKSAFAKIKDVLFKGALIAFLLNLPKILNSEAFRPILEYFTGGSFESDIRALWNNILLPIFNGIVDTIKFIVALFQGDFDAAIQLFKDNWIMIVPILAIVFGSMIASVVGYIAAIGPMVVGFLTALGPILLAAAPFIAVAGLLALAFVGIKNFLDNLVEKLNVSGITDLVFIAWGYVQDGFASFVNMFIDLANMIMETVGAAAKFLGFDFELPQLEKLETDNAEKALKAAQLNKAEADRKAAEEDKQQALTQQSNVVANSGNTNISTNSSSVTNMVSQGMPDVSQSNNFNMDEALAMG